MSASDERELLAGLIRDFPPKNPPNVEEALLTIAARYEELGKGSGLLTLALGIGQAFSFDIVETIVLTIHGYLFEDILSNAGNYRKETDPDGGLVQFGRANPRRAKESQFKGLSPSKLPDAVRVCCALLVPQDADPIETSIRFYQQFVAYHPFYDANGRIARFIVTSYLDIHGYYVEWQKLNEGWSSRFLKRLNDCHKRMESRPEDFEKYFQLLLDFWRKVVVKKEELERLK